MDLADDVNVALESQDNLQSRTILSKLLKIMTTLKFIPIKMDYKHSHASCSFFSREFLIYGIMILFATVINNGLFIFVLDGTEFWNLIQQTWFVWFLFGQCCTCMSYFHYLCSVAVNKFHQN